MIQREDSRIRMIPIDRITVLNPRSRGKTKFKQIVDNIARLGLKKPITVAKNHANTSEVEYFLVCGQGRLEAFKVLGQKEIPAVIINGTKQDFLLMSLAENLARRQHSTVELLKEIKTLKERGYSHSQIAKKTDLAMNYVRGVLQLLEKGEYRLLQAVEKGQIPISIASTIARSDDKEIQRALTEAYECETLKGKQLLAARKLIEKRKFSGKQTHTRSISEGCGPSSAELLREYHRETHRQRAFIQKAKLYETYVVFAVSAVRKLLDDENFSTFCGQKTWTPFPSFLKTKFIIKVISNESRRGLSLSAGNRENPDSTNSSAQNPESRIDVINQVPTYCFFNQGNWHH